MNPAKRIEPADLRNEAEALATGFPDLLAHAVKLAATISLGNHGRRRSGPGDEFWQYRPAAVGDHQRDIDWRRSGRSDSHFVRQMEWQNLQSVHLWVDTAASMQFCGDDNRPTKADRAKVLALATVILLSKAGESFALLEDTEPPKHGRGQITKMAVMLADASTDPEYGKPPQKRMARGSRALFISDFLGDWDVLVDALGRAADQKVEGCLLQILDPLEETFPFDGRTIFESMGGGLQFETRRAKALRDDYLQRLGERREALEDLARRTGWVFGSHHTDQTAQSALMWIHNALSGPPR